MLKNARSLYAFPKIAARSEAFQLPPSPPLDALFIINIDIIACSININITVCSINMNIIVCSINMNITVCYIDINIIVCYININIIVCSININITVCSFSFLLFFHPTYSWWTSSLPSCLWSQRIFPSLPGSRLTIFLSRCKFSTLTTRQPMVEININITVCSINISIIVCYININIIVCSLSISL